MDFSHGCLRHEVEDVTARSSETKYRDPLALELLGYAGDLGAAGRSVEIVEDGIFVCRCEVGIG
ncbi:hypothetical protein D3C87_1920520 [compost metagenome]